MRGILIVYKMVDIVVALPWLIKCFRNILSHTHNIKNSHTPPHYLHYVHKSHTHTTLSGPITRTDLWVIQGCIAPEGTAAIARSEGRTIVDGDSRKWGEWAALLLLLPRSRGIFFCRSGRKVLGIEVELFAASNTQHILMYISLTHRMHIHALLADRWPSYHWCARAKACPAFV